MANEAISEDIREVIDHIKIMGSNIRDRSISRNKELKEGLVKNRKELTSLVDSSYQNAFNPKE